jgi:hypothetical protein
MLVNRSVLGFVLTASLVTQPAWVATQADLSSLEQHAIARLRTETVRDVTTTLAGPEMEGRGMAQPGGERAANYLAGKFAAAGLKPGGDSTSYYQRFGVEVQTLLPETTLTVRSEAFTINKDFAVAQPASASAIEPVTADVVFVGYGVVSQALKRDDLAGVEVKGKIVMVLSGAPSGVDSKIWDRESAQRVVFGRLIEKHAAGFIVTYDGEASTFPAIAAAISNRTVRPTAHLAGLTAVSRWSLEILADQFNLPPSVLVSESTANSILGGALAETRQRADAGGFVSHDLKTAASIVPRVRREVGTSSNVVGVIEGSDAKLAREALVYTAHYDGFGRDTDGNIYAGAGDNALGVGKLVALAEVFASLVPRPRRSIIFIATTGEEYGDIGACYWLQHPTWPIARVAADINYDNSVPLEVFGDLAFVFDFGFDQSDLNESVRSAATASHLAIEPDPDAGEGFFARSDHYAFVKRGIPALFLVGGPRMTPRVLRRASEWQATRYHRPADVVQADWNWEGARTLAAFGLVTGLRIANQDAMPAWKPGAPYKRKTQ